MKMNLESFAFICDKYISRGKYSVRFGCNIRVAGRAHEGCRSLFGRRRTQRATAPRQEKPLAGASSWLRPMAVLLRARPRDICIERARRNGVRPAAGSSSSANSPAHALRRYQL